MPPAPLFDLLITAAIVLLIVVALAREWLAPSLVVFGGMVVLLVLGVITPAEGLAGFANPAPMTVAALFVLARAVEKTGALQPLVARALDANRGDRGTLATLLTPVAVASSFLNNTPIVAMLVSPVSAWAERKGRPVSRFLMPISFAAILGGMVTLIGTSTNLVVSGLLVSAGLSPLGMFELTPIGLPVALIGIAFIAVAAPSLLPERRGLRERFTSEMREYTVEMTVESGGAVDQRTVADAGLRHLQGVFLAWVKRGDRLITPVAPDELLLSGDRLGFVGGVNQVLDLQSIRGLRSSEYEHTRGLGEGAHGFFEAVVAPISPLVGASLKSAGFREQYQATVLAIHRSGQRVEGKLGEIPLQAGDTLLVLADRTFRQQWRDRRDFLLVSQLDGQLPVSSKKGLFVLAVAVGVVALAAFGILPILEGSLAAALAMVLARVLTPNEARNAVDLDVIILISAAFGIGSAIESSGLAALLARWLVEPAMTLGPVAVLTAVVLATLLLTELITNNAAAVLVFPIAFAAANSIGADPRAFAVAVAITASASFLTPIGYQTNTMVYGPGGYRFGDYVRLGFPLTVLVSAAVIGFTAWHWELA